MSRKEQLERKARRNARRRQQERAAKNPGGPTSPPGRAEPERTGQGARVPEAKGPHAPGQRPVLGSDAAYLMKRPERLAPGVFLDRRGAPLPDPFATLGLARTATRAQVEEAWRQEVRRHPPEADPDGFRQVQEARSLLLDPARVVERRALFVRPPDPVAWKLPVELPEEEGPAPDLLAEDARILAQLVVHALIEEEVVGDHEAAGKQLVGPAGRSRKG